MVIGLFILLNVTEENSVKNKLRDMFFSPQISVERIETPNTAPFFRMNCQKYRGIVPFNTIIAVSGRLKDRIVAPRSVEIPPSSDLKLYNSDVLKRRLLMNTAVKTLEKVSCNRKNITLSIIDEYGKYYDLLENFVLLAGEIKVYTKHASNYSAVCKMIMKKYGLLVTVIPETKFSDEYGVVISHDSRLVSPHFKGVLFTNDEVSPECCTAIRGINVDISDYIKFSVSEFDENTDIACALYDLCYAYSLGKLSYINIFVNGNDCSYEEAVNIISYRMTEYMVHKV